MKSTTVFDCTILTLPKINTPGGNITAINNGLEIPFAVRRVYYLYDVPGGESRGGHGHKALQQVIIAASGSFEVQVDDGKTKRTFALNRPYVGVHLPPGLWRELSNFSSGAICLVLASQEYDVNDYLYHYEEFLEWKSNRI